MYLSSVLKFVEENIVWGIPLIILILACGIILSVRLNGLQFGHLGESLKLMVNNKGGGTGEVSTFAALCISMAATLGTGKIVGVATAIYWGGPGALFWMIIAALLGMATKYTEGFLAVKYRRTLEDGSIIGGPFAYIEDGMGKKWKFLAILFAIFGILAGLFGIGTITQMNSINESIVSVFDPDKANLINIFGLQIPLVTLIATIVVTVISAFAVIGGIDRISKFSVLLVPIMAIGYFLVCLAVIIFNITALPAALLKIVKCAFTVKAGTGAIAGITIITVLRQGVSKGIFSNEAGLGSAPIAMASAQESNPVKAGLVTMSGTFIDTLVLCLTIGTGVVLTGSYLDNEGINITINTFETGLNIGYLPSAIIVMCSIVTFAFTTIIGWNVYGEKCTMYLFKGNKKALLVYRIIYILAVASSPFLTLDTIWTIASIFNGLMALPNLIALIALSGVVAKETKDYFQTRKLNKNLNKPLAEIQA